MTRNLTLGLGKVPWLRKQWQSLWSVTQLPQDSRNNDRACGVQHTTPQDSTGALERCSDTAQATTTLTLHLPVLLGTESVLTAKSQGMPHSLGDQLLGICLGGHWQLCWCYFYCCDVACLLISRWWLAGLLISCWRPASLLISHQQLAHRLVSLGVHQKLSRNRVLSLRVMHNAVSVAYLVNWTLPCLLLCSQLRF